MYSQWMFRFRNISKIFDWKSKTMSFELIACQMYIGKLKCWHTFTLVHSHIQTHERVTVAWMTPRSRSKCMYTFQFVGPKRKQNPNKLDFDHNTMNPIFYQLFRLLTETIFNHKNSIVLKKKWFFSHRNWFLNRTVPPIQVIEHCRWLAMCVCVCVQVKTCITMYKSMHLHTHSDLKLIKI